jgi:tetratricopeptide (TPR) repeat protein
MWERDEEKVKEPYFFATHPKLQERLDNYRRLLQNLPTSARLKEQRLVGIDSYQSRIETVLIENAVMDLERGRYKAARAALERALNRASQSPRVHFLLGELHRKSGSRSANIESAVTAYQKAIRLDPNYGEPHRELGFLYRAQGRKEEAYSEFQTYIRLCLQATDVPIIKGFLKELKGNTNGGSNHDPARLGEVR